VKVNVLLNAVGRAWSVAYSQQLSFWFLMIVTTRSNRTEVGYDLTSVWHLRSHSTKNIPWDRKWFGTPSRRKSNISGRNVASCGTMAPNVGQLRLLSSKDKLQMRMFYVATLSMFGGRRNGRPYLGHFLHVYGLRLIRYCHTVPFTRSVNMHSQCHPTSPPTA